MNSDDANFKIVWEKLSDKNQILLNELVETDDARVKILSITNGRHCNSSEFMLLMVDESLFDDFNTIMKDDLEPCLVTSKATYDLCRIPIKWFAMHNEKNLLVIFIIEIRIMLRLQLMR